DARELKNSSNQTLSKTEYAYTTDPGGSTAVQSAISTDETGQQTKVDLDYDAYGNVVNTREYGFKISGQWKVRRRTHNTYITWEPYMSAYMRNRVVRVEIFDALQNTNDGDDVLIGKSEYGYDNPMGGLETYGGTANPPGHLASYNGYGPTRGSLTDVISYSDVVAGTSVTHSSKTDIFGNTTKAQVSCCDEKSFTMSEATYWSRASQTTSGNTSGVYLTTVAGYDFNTLAQTSETDPNNQTASYGYDAATNPTAFTSPTGANDTRAYNVRGELTSKTVNYSEGGVNKTITTTAVYDAWGQMTSSVDANGAQTNYTYNNMGRLLTRTNPFPQGGTPGPTTTYQYDQLGRVTVETLPGGNTVQTAYSGSVVTVTDQVNRKIKRESDGLGRLIKVTEQDVSTSALTQETTYTYDIADHLTGVNQGGQTRAFKYDSEGHLLFERIPETAATINDGTGTYWSTKYTYTSVGAVATRQDARGVITTYGYDSLNRLTSISYNTSGATGVATTSNVTYNYDNNQSSGTKGLLLSLSVGSAYSESYSYDSFKRVSATTRVMDGLTYWIGYQYNTANQMTQITYPNGAVINMGHDSRGRLTSVGGYLTSVTYNGIGQMTGTTLGNGVSESFGYDANRMQLTSQSAAIPGNGPLMSLAYSYQAQAGQMGAGTTAGNAGQLMAITCCSSIGGLAELATYTYDNMERLVTSSQTTNGVTAQRRFAHDRWGNRTGVWDAVTGGNQIQSVALQQSGGAPTNRIQTLTSGATVTYTYDAAGNVTNDGAHSYTYDAENRLTSVDGGTSAQYSYDNQNRRYKKVSGGAGTHYIWEGSQVIGEFDSATRGLIAVYIYAVGRMIARGETGVTKYLLNDRLSERLVLDGSGNLIGRQGHLPFGEGLGESGTQEKHHFTTYERDTESAADYAINRHYASSVERFMQVDGLTSSSNQSTNFNRYFYANADPVNNSDKKGLSPSPLEAAFADRLEDEGTSVSAGFPAPILSLQASGALNPSLSASKAKGDSQADEEQGQAASSIYSPNSIGGGSTVYLSVRARIERFQPFLAIPVWFFGLETPWLSTPPGRVRFPGNLYPPTMIFVIYSVWRFAVKNKPIRVNTWGTSMWTHCAASNFFAPPQVCYLIPHTSSPLSQWISWHIR
ncbi:MAG: RHS repeat-associated core domain-containing protein, partial [Acidobacteriota bacterium]